MLRTSTIRRFSFINSRAHEGRDTPPGNGRRTATQFQLTRPRGARHFVFAPGPILKPFQLTRPRGARPTCSASAPTRTTFQLTRPRGARLPRGSSLHRGRPCFNSRAREGRDRVVGDVMYEAGGFNSRAREGRDGSEETVQALLSAFQLTRPRGARPGLLAEVIGELMFQLPRPRGARPCKACSKAASTSFQLTRPRGARPADGKINLWYLEFQLTRPRGARLQQVRRVERHQVVSTHAPARGATPASANRLCSWRCFNSRAREGRDSALRLLWRRAERFNSRAREGRDSSL